MCSVSVNFFWQGVMQFFGGGGGSVLGQVVVVVGFLTRDPPLTWNTGFGHDFRKLIKFNIVSQRMRRKGRKLIAADQTYRTFINT